MGNQSKSWVWIVIVVVAIVALALAWYYYQAPESLENTAQNSEVKEPTDEELTSDLQAVDLDGLGTEIKNIDQELK